LAVWHIDATPDIDAAVFDVHIITSGILLMAMQMKHCGYMCLIWGLVLAEACISMNAEHATFWVDKDLGSNPCQWLSQRRYQRLHREFNIILILRFMSSKPFAVVILRELLKKVNSLCRKSYEWGKQILFKLYMLFQIVTS
jgi:hypothetical protein